MSTQDTATFPGHATLARLAREDPRSFESLRLELIESLINGAPDAIQLRLRQLQFRIDGIRQRSQSPLGAAIKIQKLMWDSFLRLNDGLQEFRSPQRHPHPEKIRGISQPAQQHSARLIAFRGRS